MNFAKVTVNFYENLWHFLIYLTLWLISLCALMTSFTYRLLWKVSLLIQSKSIEEFYRVLVYPLLFNLCISTLVNTAKNEKLNCFGYVYGFSITPHNWFRFSDDTAIGKSSKEDNQLLINSFIKWCTWVDLSFRIGKCHVFGIKKLAQNLVNIVLI